MSSNSVRATGDTDVTPDCEYFREKRLHSPGLSPRGVVRRSSTPDKVTYKPWCDHARHWPLPKWKTEVSATDRLPCGGRRRDCPLTDEQFEDV